MSRYIQVALQRRVRQHFNETCAYCRTAEALTAMTFEFDHFFPRSLGGETIFENLCFACPSCNRVKSNRITFIDPESSDRVPPSVMALQMNRSSDHLYPCNVGATWRTPA